MRVKSDQFNSSKKESSGQWNYGEGLVGSGQWHLRMPAWEVRNLK